MWLFLHVQQNFNHMGCSDAIHGWMMGRMDGWKTSRKTTTMSFTICKTSCLMHKCVCIWRYILQNYNYKLHFQNLSIYHILHVSIKTLAAENLDVCIACDSWNNNM